MCTVSFIARKNGYALAMNRDEKLSRVAGLPPKFVTSSGRKCINPSEPGGGTWISLNDAGVTFALINWYSVTARASRDSISRGKVVIATRTAASAAEAAAALAGLPLAQINPFRLIGVFPGAQEICEWQWNLRRLVCKKHPWRAQQWISSGFDEPAAQRIRHATFRKACKQSSFGSLDWLRRLHRSHAPQSGPCSTCMHRADAATVSYTEILVSPRETWMDYCATAPCQHHTNGNRNQRAQVVIQTCQAGSVG